MTSQFIAASFTGFIPDKQALSSIFKAPKALLKMKAAGQRVRKLKTQRAITAWRETPTSRSLVGSTNRQPIIKMIGLKPCPDGKSNWTGQIAPKLRT
jgi:hypothetical protein